MSDPWATISHALRQLEAGDTLMIADGDYDEPESIVRLRNSGSGEAPITVRGSQRPEGAKPGVSWKFAKIEMRALDVSHWAFEGICFRPREVAFHLGDAKQKTKATHIRFRRCRFEGRQGLKIGRAEDVVVEDCHFYRIQSERIGEDMHGIAAQHYAHRLTVRGCRFEDISGDGIQVGHSEGDLRDIVIENCRFWINRNPDGTLVDQDLQEQWGNTGENGIDVKEVDPGGSVTIQNCEISGYRPTVPGQNASGAFGAGIVVHFGSRNVVVARCRLSDNSQGITVGGVRKGGGPPAEVRIENCLIHDNLEVGLSLREWVGCSLFTTLLSATAWTTRGASTRWGSSAAGVSRRERIYGSARMPMGLRSSTICSGLVSGWRGRGKGVAGSLRITIAGRPSISRCARSQWGAMRW
ncbi:MAG: right-handed parallel beta-helix repeat-containing protein [Verrucomicrobiales bacterium]